MKPRETSEEDKDTEALADLSLSREDAEEAKGGEARPHIKIIDGTRLG